MNALQFILAIWGYFIVGYLLACIVGKLLDVDISDGGGVIIFMWPAVLIVLIISCPFLLIAKLFGR